MWFLQDLFNTTCVSYVHVSTVKSPILDPLSEIGTQYNKLLNKRHFSRSQIHVIGLPIVLIHFEPPRRGQPPYEGRNTWILVSKCFLFRGSTVVYINRDMRVCSA